jgi:diacylglycerol kinase family enzyme
MAAPSPAPTPEPEPSAKSRNPMMLGLVAVVVLLLAVVGWLATRDTGGMRAGEGELVVTSRPEGAQVTVDGEVRGTTPLTVRLDAGAHVLEVKSGTSEPRVIPLTIQAGVQTAQYVELQGVVQTGTLEIRSEPSGARITIDGQVRGTTPMTVSNLTAGDHTVVLEAGGRKATQVVRIEAGATARLVVPLRR